MYCQGKESLRGVCQTRLETGSSLNVTPLSNMLHIVKISYKYIEVQKQHFISIFKVVNVNDAMNIYNAMLFTICVYRFFGTHRYLSCTNVCLESKIYYQSAKKIILIGASIFFSQRCNLLSNQLI